MGPTASGKSALGLVIAKALDGVILNADAMQCYRDIQIVTARPHQEEMQGIEHRLYGLWQAHEHGNAALWAEQAAKEIRAVWQAGKLPILLGGTGMYIRTLMDGISPIPPVPEEVKQRVEQWMQQGSEKAYGRLKLRDAATAEKLAPNDSQRIQRALEVVEATDTPLSVWQKEAGEPFMPEAEYHLYYCDIARETLYERINARFEQMVEKGAIDEVQMLQRQALSDGLPVMRAIGVAELMAYLRDELSLQEAVALAQQNSRRYAKRQLTWIRNQLPEALPVPYALAENVDECGEWLKSLAKAIDRPLAKQ